MCEQNLPIRLNDCVRIFGDLCVRADTPVFAHMYLMECGCELVSLLHVHLRVLDEPATDYTFVSKHFIEFSTPV